MYSTCRAASPPHSRGSRGHVERACRCSGTDSELLLELWVVDAAHTPSVVDVVPEVDREVAATLGADLSIASATRYCSSLPRPPSPIAMNRRTPAGAHHRPPCRRSWCRPSGRHHAPLGTVLSAGLSEPSRSVRSPAQVGSRRPSCSSRRSTDSSVSQRARPSSKARPLRGTRIMWNIPLLCVAGGDPRRSEFSHTRETRFQSRSVARRPADTPSGPHLQRIHTPGPRG